MRLTAKFLLYFFLPSGGALLLAGGGKSLPVGGASGGEHDRVRGVTISCQTWGWEWGSDGFADELADLGSLGANWVAIHPYARIRADGSVEHRRGALDPAEPPPYLARPVEDARRAGMALLVKPHLAYWGSPFGWRGEIRFAEDADRERFWGTYTEWIVSVARATRGADAFCVGTELDLMLGDEERWREVVRRVRAVTDARLTYAANWDRYQDVGFWDALDAIGVQAYFPLSTGGAPGDEELVQGWRRVLTPLRELSRRTGKPVVFTELGYDASLAAARAPWSVERPEEDLRAAAERLQARCLRVGLAVLEREREWLRGAFLWKWFVGEPGWEGETFLLDTPHCRRVIADAWRE